jgi:hypothetical protein
MGSVLEKASRPHRENGAREEQAEIFREESPVGAVHLSEKGSGMHSSQWQKGSDRPRTRTPLGIYNLPLAWISWNGRRQSRCRAFGNIISGSIFIGAAYYVGKTMADSCLRTLSQVRKLRRMLMSAHQDNKPPETAQPNSLRGKYWAQRHEN